jgi:cytochrome c oxidase subunit 2
MTVEAPGEVAHCREHDDVVIDTGGDLKFRPLHTVDYSRCVPQPSRRTDDAGRVTRSRRRWGVALLALAPFALSGCGLSSFGAYPGATKTGRSTFHLWQGFTIGAIVIGGLTLGLIVYASLRYRVKRHDADAVPRQTQYHLPMEITYTVVPIIIVFVLFAFTVVVENEVTALPAVGANNTIGVEAEQWGWTFSYPGFTIAGQTTSAPEMVMPEGENVRIVLTSADVVHGFYIKQFNFSRYALPGIINPFTFNAQQTGTFFGQCTQLCGVYHSLMWFKVKVVSPRDYGLWLASQQTRAARIAAIAAGETIQEQNGAGVPIRPDYGGGTG